MHIYAGRKGYKRSRENGGNESCKIPRVPLLMVLKIKSHYSRPNSRRDTSERHAMPET